MAHSQYAEFTVNLLPVDYDGLKLPVLDDDVFQARPEPDFASGIHNALAYPGHNIQQEVTANMGFGVNEYRITCTAGVQQFHEFPDSAPFLAAGGEFAVGKQACSAFSVEHIAFGVQSSVMPEVGHLDAPCGSLLAAFN